ncbi:MAG: glycosyltransferase [Sedimentisphaerales bacterium]|nr:glycosyltransferase [Sedimentisphaerales bacterium]
MKNVLMLTYMFYPCNHIASQRTAKTAKYLPEYGWKPVIVCPKWTKENSKYFDAEMVAEFDRSNVAKAIDYENNLSHNRFQKLLAKCISNPDPRVLVVSFLRRYALLLEKHPPEFYYGAIAFLRKYLRTNRVDCVWATEPVCHTIADWIQKKFGIPWVADFRDILDQKGLPEHERGHSYLKKVEPRIISSASAIVTVSEPLKEVLQTRHKMPVHVINNGFDPSDYDIDVQQNREIFNIVYTGKIIFPLRDPSPLFEALATLISDDKVESSKINVSFYGTESEDILDRLIQNYPALNNVVHIFPRVSFRKSIQIQKQASILLHLAHGGEKGIMTGKVFEYLGARRPILCIPGDNDCVDALLKETKAGVSCRNSEETAAQVLYWYQEWLQTGTVSYHARDEQSVKYSREKQAGQLAELLDSICLRQGVLN